MNSGQPTLLITYKPQPQSEAPLEQLSTASGADKIDLLANLLKNSSKEDLADILAAFMPKEKATRKATPHASRVLQRKVLTVHYHCRNCDHTRVYTFELAKGQTKSWVRKDGTVGYVMVKANWEPLTVQSWTNSCEMCKVRIATWTREKLEERYLQLLCRLTFSEPPSTTNDWYKNEPLGDDPL